MLMLLGLLLPILMNSGCRPDQHTLPDYFDLQGHRGAMGLRPENTLSGFFKAVDLGVRTIEFDLAVSKEHKLIISHDPWFRSDLCLQPDGSPIPKQKERTFRLYELSYEEIAQFDCGSLQHPSHPEQVTETAKKPLMTEAMNAIDEYINSRQLSPVRYNIEIKTDPAWDRTLTPDPDDFARLVYEELQQVNKNREGNILERVNIQSFDPRALKAFRNIAPTVPIAILIYEEGTVDEHIDHFGFLPEIYSPNYGLLSEEHMERAHELGMRVIPWTVNRPQDMKEMVRLGVDGLITDYPDRFNELYVIGE